jgi:hypothetical protein
MALQQEVNLAISCHLCRDGCGILCAHKLCPGDQVVEPEGLRQGADFPFVANQHGHGKTEMKGAIGRCQADLVVSYDNRNAFRAQELSAPAKFAEARYFPSIGRSSSAGKHVLFSFRQNLRAVVRQIPQFVCGGLLCA